MKLPMHNLLLGEGDVNQSRLRTRWTDRLNNKTKELLNEDSTYFFHQSLSTPCLDVIKNARGAQITTEDGRQLYDFHGNGVHQAGFQHPKIIEAMKQQLDNLSFSTRRYTNQPAIDFAKKLAQRTPDPLNKVLFAPGATSAIGMALKIARLSTGKFKTLSMWEAFHGASMDALSVGGEAHFRRDLGPLLPGTIHVPPIQTYRPNWEGASLDGRQLIQYIGYILEQESEIGAFIMEPIRNTDVQIPSYPFMKELRQVCTTYDVKLIFDETATGLGRTGKWFAFNHYDIVPDMVVLGKGLGGGVFPMAALLIDEALDTMSYTSIGHYTHEKSPLGASASSAVLDVIEEEKLLIHTKELGRLASERLQRMMENHPLIGDVRQIGLLIAIELVRDRTTKEKAVEETEQVMYACLERGLSFKVSKGNVIQLCPPLIITKSQLEEALTILDKALTVVQEGRSRNEA
ncbi:aspartate aminotransferase family protein [Halobacillus salinarum]|uniref:Aspartate aminotransferase family protein n=1 Tax=Halobacillus salinarum TaxID=2932257 RepID=A0ABY4EIH8_9BACI|nr:aspartate aminotransferase family protein [Halobacillus salinarum]UOQ43307.1 aspartate aminotransferase family protein [Halobacillus salinarum]